MTERFNNTIDLLSSLPLLILVGLGVFSLTRVVVSDTFPWCVTLRDWLFERFPPSGLTTRKRPTNNKAKWILTGDRYFVNVGHWFGDLISCNWCAGFWISIFVTVALIFQPTVTLIVLMPFALRAIAGLIGSIN